MELKDVPYPNLFEEFIRRHTAGPMDNLPFHVLEFGEEFQRRTLAAAAGGSKYARDKKPEDQEAEEVKVEAAAAEAQRVKDAVSKPK